MESAAYRNSSEARRVMRVYSAVLLGIGLPYSALAAWPGSPWELLVPNAYAVSGLVLLTLLANISNGLSAPLRAEILGGRREPQLARMEVVGNSFRLIVAGFSGALRAYSVPVGFLLLGAVRWVMAAVGRRAVYLGGSDVTE